MTVASVVLEQVSFRARGDTVGLNVDTWDFVLNGDFTQAVDTTFRVRFTIAETNGGMANNKNFLLQYNLEGAGFVAIGDTAAVKASLSSQFTDGDPTTQIISSGEFVPGIGVEGPTTSNISLLSNRTEIEWAIEIDGAQVNDADTIVLRVVEAGPIALNTYTNSPTITVSKAAGQDLVQVVSEGVGVEHVTKRPRGLARLLADALGLTEQVNRVRGLIRTSVDALDIGEQVNTIRGLVRGGDDAVGVGEDAQRTRVLIRIIGRR